MITSTVNSGTHEHDEAYSEEAEDFVPSSTNSDSSEHKSNSSVNHQEEIKLLKDKIKFYQQSQKRLQSKVKCLQAAKTFANDGKADIKVKLENALNYNMQHFLNQLPPLPAALYTVL
ncbi:hypothetical protein ElyMa_003866900 [Elysia marginata]|uniref:REM-1 domain-containing protein n=1 Tax=Elysia marginata TaxID=1093978 RepID=A0AAV4FJ35_9GAST|nr:hypothetical protein ElyMa_003866900 [Elysia marginata]